MLTLVKQKLPLDPTRVAELLDRVLGRTADEQLKQRLLRLLLDTAIAGAEQPANLLGTAVTISPDHPVLRRLAVAHTPQIVGVNETTRNRIREGLLRIVADGGSLKEQVDLVKAVFREARTTRALTIARTENTIFFHAGGRQQMVESGAKAHMWISSRDARVRDTHVVADGQCREIGEAFDVGGAKLMHPGDPAGPPREVIQCRCTELPLVTRCGVQELSPGQRAQIWRRAIAPISQRERMTLRSVRVIFREQRSAMLDTLEQMTR